MQDQHFMPQGETLLHSDSPARSASPATPFPFRACIIIPAFDAAASIGAVIGDLEHHLPQLASSETLFVVDDGSRDATSGVAREAGARVLTARLHLDDAGRWG